jgi:hypothetical protein
MGKAPVLLDEYMKDIKAAIVDYATTSVIKHVWWTKEGGEDSVHATGNHIFDQHNSTLLVHDRSALSFIEKPTLPLSSLEIALQPHLRGIMTHLSSCLQLAGVTGHPAGGSAAAFAKSTARFEHDRPDGLEEMSDTYRAEMWRRLHIASCSRERAALLTRTRSTSSAQTRASSCWLFTPERGRSRPMEDHAIGSQLPAQESAHGEC